MACIWGMVSQRLHIGLFCCRIESVPFKLCQASVGGSPRRYNMWNPVIENMKKRLSSWKGRHFSIGGWVTLINSVLNSIPLCYISFPGQPERFLNILGPFNTIFFAEVVIVQSIFVGRVGQIYAILRLLVVLE